MRVSRFSMEARGIEPHISANRKYLNAQDAQFQALGPGAIRALCAFSAWCAFRKGQIGHNSDRCRATPGQRSSFGRTPSGGIVESPQVPVLFECDFHSARCLPFSPRHRVLPRDRDANAERRSLSSRTSSLGRNQRSRLNVVHAVTGTGNDPRTGELREAIRRSRRCRYADVPTERWLAIKACRFCGPELGADSANRARARFPLVGGGLSLALRLARWRRWLARLRGMTYPVNGLKSVGWQRLSARCTRSVPYHAAPGGQGRLLAGGGR